MQLGGQSTGSARLDEARDTAAALLNELEMEAAPVSQVLMRAIRLARLVYDDEAQLWLSWEASGYPSNWTAALDQIPTCRKYVERSGRLSVDGDRMHLQSLPEVEALVEANRADLQNWSAPTTVAPSASGGGGDRPDFTGLHIGNATKQAVGTIVAKANQAHQSFVGASGRYHAFRLAVHSYAVETHLALSLGDVAEDVFAAARADVDSFVRAKAPKAVEQLLAIQARIQEGEGEALAQALTSCRRVLLTVADAVFPAQDEPFVDRSGIERDVSDEAYKNRLLAFLDRHAAAETEPINVAELEHLASRLDAVYENLARGFTRTCQ